MTPDSAYFRCKVKALCRFRLRQHYTWSRQRGFRHIPSRRAAIAYGRPRHFRADAPLVERHDGRRERLLHISTSAPYWSRIYASLARAVLLQAPTLAITRFQHAGRCHGCAAYLGPPMAMTLAAERNIFMPGARRCCTRVPPATTWPPGYFDISHIFSSRRPEGYATEEVLGIYRCRRAYILVSQPIRR